MRQEKNTKVTKASCSYIGAWDKNLKYRRYSEPNRLAS
jgi:hypothetical protein